MADTQSITIAQARIFSADQKLSCMAFATRSRTPVCSTAHTIINKNMKKPITSHSISLENVSCIRSSISSFESCLQNFLRISLSLISMRSEAHMMAGTAAGIWSEL